MNVQSAPFIVSRLFLALSILLHLGNATAECYSVDNMKHECRYPKGDLWCQSRHLGPYAYSDECLSQLQKPSDESQYRYGDTTYENILNNKDAQELLRLGELYAYGKYVPRDDKKAVQFFLMAAEKGNMEAQYKLGVMYEGGFGVTQDFATAYTWYQQAAQQGHGAAANNIGTMYEKGKGVNTDPVEAIKWYRNAAAKGVAAANYNLGDAYLYGTGVAKDRIKAIEYYRIAQSQGLEVATKKLRQISSARDTGSSSDQSASDGAAIALGLLVIGAAYALSDSSESTDSNNSKSGNDSKSGNSSREESSPFWDAFKKKAGELAAEELAQSIKTEMTAVTYSVCVYNNLGYDVNITINWPKSCGDYVDKITKDHFQEYSCQGNIRTLPTLKLQWSNHDAQYFTFKEIAKGKSCQSGNSLRIDPTNFGEKWAVFYGQWN